MSLNFLAMDFETANTSSDSACSIGLVRVENSVITREAVHLIRPPTPDFMFTQIHGLTWEHVQNAPDFGTLWPEISPLFRGVDFVVAHNISFDARVLDSCCKKHGIEIPRVAYHCTVELARRVFGIYPTKLSNVCRVLNIPLNHHEALSDARACAQIVLLASRKTADLQQGLQNA